MNWHDTRRLFRTPLRAATILILFHFISGTVSFLAFGAEYQAGSIVVTTFDQEAEVNGTNIMLTPDDSITLNGGTLSVTGNGSAYSATVGTGTDIQTGFGWGTGGTINLGTDVSLEINVPSTTTVALTQTGTGTLELTGTGTQNLTLTQNSGTMNVSGDLTTRGNSITIRGALTVDGTYSDYASQTNVYGTVTSQTVDFFSGGLAIEPNGEFIVLGHAVFTNETVIRNIAGLLDVGDNSELESTSIADSGTIILGAGTVITGVIGNAGTINAEGTIEFSHVSNNGTIHALGDATFDGELDTYGGIITLDQSGTFTAVADLFSGSTLEVKETAEFQDTLTVAANARLTVGGNLTSSADIIVTGGTLQSSGNIVTQGQLSTTGNSILGLSNRLQGSELGNLQAEGGINLSSTTQIETDFSGLTSYKEPVLLVHMTAGDSTDDFMIDSAPTNVETVGSMFGTSTLLRQIYAVDNGVGYDIYGRVMSLGDFAQSEGLDKPAVEAGNAVDGMINTISPSNPAYDMVEDLLNEGDKNVINQTLYNLATGYGVENVFAMTLANFGQAGSPFFQGRASGLPTKSNQCRGQSHRRFEHDCTEVWAAPFYQSLDTNGPSWQPGFNMHRTGIMVGVRNCEMSRATAGLLFAYSAPRLNQSGALSGYDAQFHSRLDLDDWQLAAHWEYETDNQFRFFLFAGGGSQRLNVQRQARGTSSNGIPMNQSFSGDTDGNTVSATVYLERPFCLGEGLAITPVVGIDCMYAWLYGFGETSTGSGAWQDMTNLSEGNFYSPVQYGRTEYRRIMARAGLKGEYNTLRGGLSVQAIYGTQLGGDDCAVMSVSTLGGALNNRVYGYGLGRDSLNLGGGAWRFITPTRTVTAAIHYNYFTLSQCDASNVTASIAWMF